MSEADKLVARQWFDEVWNQKSAAAIDRMFHPTGKAYGFGGPDGVLEGPEAFKQAHRDFVSAFPDVHVDIDEILSEGDQVAIRWTATMTHSGDGLGFPATGKKVVLHGSSFVQIEGGQITEGSNRIGHTGDDFATPNLLSCPPKPG